MTSTAKGTADRPSCVCGHAEDQHGHDGAIICDAPDCNCGHYEPAGDKASHQDES